MSPRVPFRNEAVENTADIWPSAVSTSGDTMVQRAASLEIRSPLKSSHIQGLISEGQHPRQREDTHKGPEVKIGIRKVRKRAKCTMAEVAPKKVKSP